MSFRFRIETFLTDATPYLPQDCTFVNPCPPPLVTDLPTHAERTPIQQVQTAKTPTPDPNIIFQQNQTQPNHESEENGQPDPG